jgi:hypothetical protein
VGDAHACIVCGNSSVRYGGQINNVNIVSLRMSSSAYAGASAIDTLSVIHDELPDELHFHVQR